MRLILTLALAAACGDDDAGPTPTPQTIIEGNAVQIFVKEGVKIGWFNSGDDVQLESEPLLFAEALAKAEDLDLSLYPTIAATPPYPDGLPGWLITVPWRILRFAKQHYARPRHPTAARRSRRLRRHHRPSHLLHALHRRNSSPETPRETLPPESPTG